MPIHLTILETLEKELAHLSKLHVIMRYLQRLLVSQKFEEVNHTISQVQVLESSIQECENTRITLLANFRPIQHKDNIKDYSDVRSQDVLRVLPHELRAKAAKVIHAMREKVMHIQMLSQSIKRFSIQSSDNLRAVLSELYPEERQYTRDGTHVESRQMALLCNQEK